MLQSVTVAHRAAGRAVFQINVIRRGRHGPVTMAARITMRTASITLLLLTVTLSVANLPRVTHADERNQITRHKVDLDYCRKMLADRREEWPKYLEYARRKPNSLSGLARESLDIVRYGIVVEPESEDIPRMLRIAAQAYTGLFVVQLAAGKRVEWTVGDEVFVYEGKTVDESIANAGKWLDAFQLALICRDDQSLDALCEFTTDQLRQSSTTHPEYVYLLVDAYRGYRNKADDTFQRVLAALRRTDPEAEKNLDFDYTLEIAVPLIEVFGRCVTRDKGRFDSALHKAVELHKEYYSASERRRDDRKGFMSIPLTAMAAHARDHEISFDVQSPYLPVAFVKGDCFKKKKTGVK